jgi:hypothetical protein
LEPLQKEAEHILPLYVTKEYGKALSDLQIVSVWDLQKACGIADHLLFIQPSSSGLATIIIVAVLPSLS